MEALEFIRWIHTKPLHQVPVGARVAVIGCGNTAIDAVTQAKRLGAKEAVIVYRRGEEDMPAYEYEYELAKADACGFLFHTAVVEVLGDKEVTGLRLAKTRTDKYGKTEIVKGSEFEEPFDMVIKATGQEKQAPAWKKCLPKLKFDDKGRIEVKKGTGQTSVPKVFAGGDAVNGEGKWSMPLLRERKQRSQSMRCFRVRRLQVRFKAVGWGIRTGREGRVSFSLCEFRNWKRLISRRRRAGLIVADLSINLAGIRSPNPFGLLRLLRLTPLTSATVLLRPDGVDLSGKRSGIQSSMSAPATPHST